MTRLSALAYVLALSIAPAQAQLAAAPFAAEPSPVASPVAVEASVAAEASPLARVGFGHTEEAVVPVEVPTVSPVAFSDVTRPATGRPSRLGRYANWMVGDVTGFFSNARPLHVATVAGVGGALALGSLADVALSEEAQEQYTGVGAPFFDAVNELGGRYALLGAGALWGGTMLTNDARLQDAAFTSLEAGVYAATITGVLKSTVGRVRPIDGSDPYDFQPFSGNTSFPSGHTTLAFALTVPWAVYYPGPVTYGLVGLAGGTAVARVVLTHHWPSDVVGGALIGGLTGYVLARRHLRLGDAPNAPTLSASPVPVPGGAGLTLRLQF